MSTIEILYKDPKFDELAIEIDGTRVDTYTRLDNRIVIDCDLDFGLHQLSVTMLKGKKLKITDFRVDGASVRMMLFLSHIQHHDTIIQPATTLWGTDHTWTIPFANPVSFWQSLVHNKIPQGDFGQNLYEKYHLFFPEKLRLDSEFPSVLKTFFEHDFDFVCLPKNTPRWRLPYSEFPLSLDLDLRSQTAQEILDNRAWVFEHRDSITQEKYNAEEFDDTPGKEWCKKYLVFDEILKYDPETLPYTHKFIDHLPLKGIKRVVLGLLPPGGCIAPHTDNVPESRLYQDGSHFYVYVPILWPPGNFFKINGAGILKNDVPFIINHVDNVHAVVNTSNDDRIILGIQVPVNLNQDLLNV